MIRDLELLMDISPLWEKQIIIWGMGKWGQIFFSDLVSLGVIGKNILLCDSDEQKWGEYHKHKIMSPKEMRDTICGDNYLIIISPENIEVQDEIIEEIARIGLDNLDICTGYTVKWGLYLNRKEYRNSETMKSVKGPDPLLAGQNTQMDILKFLIYAPFYEKVLLVYQPGKVGSTTIYKSVQNYGIYSLHVHKLTWAEHMKGDMEKFAQTNCVKIITSVRDPIARQIAGLWQNLPETWRYGENADFNKIQDYFLSEEAINQQFRWFHLEMEEVFGIDVYKYPFDKELGYTIIKKGNIEVLLFTLEKLDGLENVIGDFLGVKNFRLERDNEGKNKEYRFAYKSYKQQTGFPESILDKAYRNNPYVNHFYSGEMIESFYKKWGENTF